MRFAAYKMTETINLFGDTETGSECNLKVCGAYRYAEDPSTFIQLFSYAVEDEPVKLWSPYDGEPMPDDLHEYLLNPKFIWTFHNAQFDRLIIRHCVKIEVPIRRFRCSMAQALSHALPGSLEKCGEVMGLTEEQAKVKDGKKLVHLFCKPKKLKDGTLKWATPETHPAEWARYKEYCTQDTASMRTMTKKLPKWNYPRGNELELWFLDQEVNDRGMPIDMPLVNSAVTAIETRQKELAIRTQELTEGEVRKASQRDAMIRHIAAMYGIDMPDMKKTTLETMLEDEDLPPGLKELINVRLATCTSSTAKYKKLIKAICSDGRLRGTILYAGASRTLRDAGRMYNPLNLPRPTLKHNLILSGIDSILSDTTDLLGYDIMELTSSCLRYAVKAPLGKKLCVSDLAAIEARVTPYLANEQWKVKFFADFDITMRKYHAFVDARMGGKHPTEPQEKKLRELFISTLTAKDVFYDNYEAAYAKSFNLDPGSVTKDQRQIGKIQELALGFGGGAGSLVSFCVMYHIDIDDMARKIIPSLPEGVLKEANSFFDWMGRQEIKDAKAAAIEAGATEEDYEEFKASRTYGLSRETYAALDALKRLWRNEHPSIARTWKEADTAMRNAIEVPNERFHFGKMFAIRKGKWVLVVLPSGHIIPYPGASITKKGDIIFKGTNQYTRRWQAIRTTGAKVYQNCVQAFARDIFKFGQLKAERDGYSSILTVYDEMVTEVPDMPEYSVQQLESIMSTNPPWALDLPLSAEGFEDYRYHK